MIMYLFKLVKFSLNWTGLTWSKIKMVYNLIWLRAKLKWTSYIPHYKHVGSSRYIGLVRLAGGWWLRLIYYERKILLADWWPVAGGRSSQPNKAVLTWAQWVSLPCCRRLTVCLWDWLSLAAAPSGLPGAHCQAFIFGAFAGDKHHQVRPPLLSLSFCMNPSLSCLYSDLIWSDLIWSDPVTSVYGYNSIWSDPITSVIYTCYAYNSILCFLTKNYRVYAHRPGIQDIMTYKTCTEI
jgi:hypothetical protein